jgi:L-fuculose-phosphate aldolase
MLTAIGDVMRRCYEKGWITTRDGNISLRRKNSNILYITPSGWRKTIIHPEHIVKCRLDEYKELIVPQNSKPSGELYMHYLIQRDSQTTRAVLHVHATNIVAAMYAGFSLPEISTHFPEIHRYTRVGASVSAVPALSKELAVETADNLYVKENGSYEFDIVGQKNHGVCAVGKDPWDAYEHVERLDHICEIVLKGTLLR